MIFESTPTIHTEIPLPDVLRQISNIYSLSEIFTLWPSARDKATLRKKFREENALVDEKQDLAEGLLKNEI